MKGIFTTSVLVIVSSMCLGQNSYPATGTAVFNSGGDQSFIIKDSRSGNNWNYMEWQFNNGTRDWVLGRKTGNGYFTLWRSGINEVLTVDNSGNVGIGTTNPGSKLHVDGGHVYVGPLSSSLTGTGRLSVSGQYAEVSFSNRAVTSFVETPTLGERFVIYNEGSATDGKLRFWSSGDKMTLTKDGNLGIGTTTPGSFKLAVEGKIGAREVNVTTAAWSDYVFNDDYHLRSLTEVQEFIKENHHLPDVPSEKEVLQNGQDLGAMNAVLLKKIEELTLYVIEQNKRTEKFEKENEDLKERVLEIEKLMKN